MVVIQHIPRLTPNLGFEPRTWRLTAARSTFELVRKILNLNSKMITNTISNQG